MRLSSHRSSSAEADTGFFSPKPFIRSVRALEQVWFRKPLQVRPVPTGEDRGGPTAAGQEPAPLGAEAEGGGEKGVHFPAALQILITHNPFVKAN